MSCGTGRSREVSTDCDRGLDAGFDTGFAMVLVLTKPTDDAGGRWDGMLPRAVRGERRLATRSNWCQMVSDASVEFCHGRKRRRGSLSRAKRPAPTEELT